MEWNQEIMWEGVKKEMLEYIACLGFPKELGEKLAGKLGSPSAVDQMNAFLYRVEPCTEELITEEMTSICRKTGLR